MRTSTTTAFVMLLALGALVHVSAAPLAAGAQPRARVSADNGTAPALRGGAPTPAFRMIVHASSPYARLGRDFVATAFLRKASRWPNGETIRPVDQSGDAPARRKFSSDVLHRSVQAVRSYWQQLIFSGRGLPPPELSSDQEVLRYVTRNAGAIGYVSGASELPGVKAVSLD